MAPRPRPDDATATSPVPASRHSEALRLSWWQWLAGLGLALVVAGQLVSGHDGLRAVLGWSLVPLTAAALALLSRRRVEVVDGELRVPGAVVPVTALGEPQPLDRRATSRVRGRSRPAGAFVPTVPWVPTAVLVPLLDPADPVPAWVVPSRRPAALAAALRSAAGKAGAHDR